MRFNTLPKLLILSVAFIVGGIISLVTWPILLKNMLVIQPGSTIFKFWQKFPARMPFNAYFFNWTNPQDIHNRSVQPKFEEIGPFRYWLTEEKQNITWNNNGTVTYRQVKRFYHNPENSKDIKMNITTLNKIATSVAYASRYFSPIIRQIAYYGLVSLGHDIHFTHSFEELLFTGFEDLYVVLTSRTPFYATFWYKNWDLCAWFYRRNGSSEFEGVYNVGTGIDSEVGTLYRWNYSNRTSYYEGHCAEVKGSTGVHEPLSKDKSYTLFSVDMGRYLTLKYVGEEYVSNILGFKYILSDESMDNGTMFPENKCFCNGECIPSGVFNASGTREGIPLFISLPHFYRADPYYTNSIRGVKPDKMKHEPYIIVEPTTGIPLRAEIKAQINFMLESYTDLPLYRDLKRTFFPILWVHQEVIIPDQLFDILKTFFLISTICKYTGIILIVIGFLQIIFIVYKRHKTFILDREKCLYTRQNTNCSEMNHKEKTVGKHKYSKVQCFSTD